MNVMHDRDLCLTTKDKKKRRNYQKTRKTPRRRKKSYFCILCPKLMLSFVTFVWQN